MTDDVHHYGDDKTIHRTGIIDVEIDSGTGEVLAVWFRCLNLPFRVYSDGGGTRFNPADMTVSAVDYEIHRPSDTDHRR